MDWIIKNLPISTLVSFMPFLLMKAGNAFKNKDDNTTGTDDAFGNVLIALAPALEAFNSGNNSAFRKALEVAHKTLGNYLDNYKAN